MDLRIDEGFRKQLWPLSALEFTNLEQSIIVEGCREPICVWNGVIIDGHNRYEICRKNELEFQVRQMEFDSRDAVEEWIDKNQAGRRNVTPDQYKIITGRIYNRRKKHDGERGPAKKLDQIEPAFDSTARQVAEEMGVSAPTVKRDAKRAEVYDKLVDAGEEEAAELVRTAPQKVINAVAKQEPDVIAEAVKKPHVANNSGEQDWYTPAEFIESARQVLGSIELDPASSEVANRIVKADRFFSRDDSGLEHDWSGRVWLNPPYSAGLVDDFVSKLLACRDDIEAALVLVNNATETKWFQSLLSAGAAVCFPRGRIKFLDSTGEPKQSPLQGQAFVYLGEKVNTFIGCFKKYGVCMEVRE